MEGFIVIRVTNDNAYDPAVEIEVTPAPSDGERAAILEALRLADAPPEAVSPWRLAALEAAADDLDP